MKKILMAGILLASTLSANASDLNDWEIIESTPLNGKEMPAHQTAGNVVQHMNSSAKYGIYVAGRTVGTIGSGLTFLGNKVGAFGASYMIFERTIVSNLISPLSFAAQLGMEYAAWNTGSKAISLSLKDLADTIEARGAKTSYLSKVAWLTTKVGFGCAAIGYGLRWLGKKACSYGLS